MMLRNAIALSALALLLLGCGETLERPNVDGYTLRGLVVDSITGAPIGAVNVLLGLEPDLEFRLYALTDSSGAFLFQPAPNSAPHHEVFRFEKAGYVTLELRAVTATRVGDYDYRLQAHLQSEGVP